MNQAKVCQVGSDRRLTDYDDNNPLLLLHPESRSSEHCQNAVTKTLIHLIRDSANQSKRRDTAANQRRLRDAPANQRCELHEAATNQRTAARAAAANHVNKPRSDNMAPSDISAPQYRDVDAPADGKTASLTRRKKNGKKSVIGGAVLLSSDNVMAPVTNGNAVKSDGQNAVVARVASGGKKMAALVGGRDENEPCTANRDSVIVVQRSQLNVERRKLDEQRQTQPATPPRRNKNSTNSTSSNSTSARAAAGVKGAANRENLPTPDASLISSGDLRLADGSRQKQHVSSRAKVQKLQPSANDTRATSGRHADRGKQSQPDTNTVNDRQSLVRIDQVRSRVPYTGMIKS